MRTTCFTILLLGAALFFSQCSSGTGTATQEKKPNVIVLFTDQHQKAAMGIEGHPDVITPHLDQLAQESVIFDRAYAAQGICVPSRSALMAGLSVRTMGFLNNGGKTSVMNEALSMASIFKQNGYRTYAFGKRHLRDSIGAGWDVKKGHGYHPGDNDNYVSWIERNGYAREFAEDWAAEFGKGPRGSSEFESEIPTADLGTRISKLPEDYTMEAYTAMETVKVIKRHARSQEPFFCWANFYRPHQPYTPLKKYMAMYDVSTWGEGTTKGGAIKKPKSFHEPAEHLPPLLQSQRNGGNKVWNMDKAFRDEQLWRDYIGAYYALVTEIDHCVGRILSALEEAELAEETLVIYTSDHGDFVGNHGMIEKAAAGHNVYEDILNVPLILRYPGRVRPGTRSAELVSLVDVLPTLVELLDLKVPPLKHPLQGLSLADLATEGRSLGRTYLVSESWSQASVITDDYKLGIMLDPTAVHASWDYRAFGDMFFDRTTDPLEMQNRIREGRYVREIKRLRSHYEAFKRAVPATGKRERIRQAQSRGNH